MKRKIYIIATLLLTIIGVIGGSYAYLKTEVESKNPSSIVLGNMDVVLLTDISSVSLNKTYPMLDSEGLKNEKVTFKIQNQGTMSSNYKVSLVDNETVKSTMANSSVRYQLTRKNEATNETTTLEIKNLDALGLIDEGTIEVGVIYTYELILWIDINANPNNQSFSKVIQVEGMQVSNLDKSGANFPELLSNMIPVYYDKTSDTEGVWRVADSTNLNETYQWFDYNDYMWANAVTVKETSTLTTLTLSDGTTKSCTGTNGVCTRDDYLNSSMGTVIPMDDITTMWVWIPRYKYTMFTGLNEPSEEQLIEVTFEHGIDTTGTITCQDNILTASDSASSETCTDSTYGSIIKNKSTYTHPAFTFGEEELTGFWMAKFEMSTDDTTCINSKNATNCNKTDLNILVKPSVDALSYQTISTEFASIRRMEIYGNIHGFSQSENATSHLDGNSYLTGEILNDNNNFDTHMLKNMEWGAVAYLSQSSYGKWSNSLYSGNYRRVYKNNYYTSSNNVYKTGYSGGNYNSSYSTTNTYLYNDMTITATGQGYRGTGASTTGTIYGVYDINGGLYDYVMASHVNSSGNFYPSSAGTWVAATSGNIPNTKYYDKYSYNGSSYSTASQTRGKLGDGTKEVTTTFGSFTGGWGGVSRYMPFSGYSWFNRGGLALVSNYGVFNSNYYGGDQNSLHGTRPVLAVSRDFPWLSE